MRTAALLLSQLALLVAASSAFSADLNACFGMSPTGYRQCSVVPHVIGPWSYDLPGSPKATPRMETERAAIDEKKGYLSSVAGYTMCSGVYDSVGPFDIAWEDGGAIFHRKYDFRTFNTFRRKPVRFDWSRRVSDPPGACYPLGANDYVYSRRTVACAAGWSPEDSPETAFCARNIPIEDKTCTAGNPVAPATGVKYHTESDYAGSGADPLMLDRVYRSSWPYEASQGSMGRTWFHGFDRRVLKIKFDATHAVLRIVRPNNSIAAFMLDPASPATAPVWLSMTTKDRLTQTGSVDAPTGYTYQVFDTDVTETFSGDGRLLSIRQRNGHTTTLTYSDAATPVYSYLTGSTTPQPGLLTTVINHFGRSLGFVYNAGGQLVQLLPPGAVKDSAAGQISSPIRYAYAEPASLGIGVVAAGQLTSVTWQDGHARRYHYEDSRFPAALSGITDESGVRLSTYLYDAQGKVAEESKVGGVDRLVFSYSTATTYITDYSGANGSAVQRYYSFQNVRGVSRPTTVSKPCSLCGNTQKTSVYDAAGNTTKTLGHDGVVSFYAYDALGRETEKATFPSNYQNQSATTRPPLSAATSVTSTQWHPTWRLPLQVAEPGKLTVYTYDDRGNLTGESWTATTDATGAQGFGATATGSAYATGWAYDGNSLPVSIVEQTDATETGRWTLTYNALGDVASMTDVVRGTTARMGSYDVHGRMLAGTTDAGVAIGFAYAPRGFYAGKTVNGQVVTFTQNAIGLTTDVSMPGGQTLGYVYDAAHRLTDIRLNGASITPAMLASADYPRTFAKAQFERLRVLLEQSVTALLPSAFAQGVGSVLRPVPVVPGGVMPGQPEFDPRRDMMMMAPMSRFDKAVRGVLERFARLCECKPEGGHDRPTFTFVSYAHVLASGHLTPRFSDKSYFASTENVGQALVDEVMALGDEKPDGDKRYVVVEAELTRPLAPVGYSRTGQGAFVPTNKVRLVYERDNCDSSLRARNEVVTMYPIP